MNSNLSVVLVHRNDHERGQISAALAATSGVTVAGERTDLRAGLALAHQVTPAILVLELTSPVDETLNAAAQYRMEHPDVAIFLMSDQFDPDTLLRALRAGAQEVLRRPLDRAALTAAVERVAALNARKAGTGAGRTVYTVFSNKGGSGVSTIAANLAVCLHVAGAETVLADLDPQAGDAAFLLGLSPARSLADVIAAQRIESADVQDALARHASGLAVLAQPEQPDRLEGFSAAPVGQVLDCLAHTHDAVVVDAPHAFTDVTLEIFDRSSVILLVVEQNMASVRAARRALEILDRLNILAVPGRVRLVVNRANDRDVISLRQLEETLGVPVYFKIASDYSAASKATSMGQALCDEFKDSRASKDLVKLARELRTPVAPREPAAANGHPNGHANGHANGPAEAGGNGAAQVAASGNGNGNGKHHGRKNGKHAKSNGKHHGQVQGNGNGNGNGDGAPAEVAAPVRRGFWPFAKGKSE